MVSIEYLIQEALRQLQTKEQFRQLFESAIMQGRDSFWLYNPKLGEKPSDQVDHIYQILVSGKETTKHQCELFEEVAFEIILDEFQYVRKPSGTRFTLGDLLLHDIIRNPDVKSSQWPEMVKEAIKVEDIASGKIHHSPYNPDEPLDGQTPTFYHQEKLLEFLVGQRAQDYGAEFWASIRQNPSFVEIDFLLARKESNEAVDKVLPRLFKFYHEILAPDVAPTRCYFLVIMRTHFAEELAIDRFLADPENEYKTKVKALTRMKIDRPELASVFNQGDAIFMSGYARDGGNATVSYILIEDGVLSRQQTILDMKTGKVLAGRPNHSSMLWDFSKQYETFVQQYRTELSKF